MTTVFLHGLGQGPESWEAVCSAITFSDDLACTNLSELLGDKEPNYQNLYTSMKDYLDGVDAPFRLCGLSLGGILALNYAMEHPGMVSALIVVGARHSMPKTLLRIQNFILRIMPRSMFENAGWDKQTTLQLTRSMSNLDLKDGLNAIDCPTLVICGGKDTPNIDAAKYISDSIKRSTLVLIEGSGHEVNVEAPQKLAAEMSEFILSSQKAADVNE